MKLNLKQQQSGLPAGRQGFTIIEVVIVLAIAATIMVVVFLAVPALQRNSRNNQYKNEAAQLAAAAQEFAGNHSGTPAAAQADATSVLGLTQNKKITTLTYQNPAAAAATFTFTNFNTAWLQTGVKCDATTIGTSSGKSTTTNATTTSTIIAYYVETPSSQSFQCIDS